MSYQNNKRYNKKPNTIEFNFIKKPLSEVYKNKSELYLPNGKAEKYADEFKKIPSHQLRKILNQTKEAVLESEINFEVARNLLFSIVPLAAYNAGRDSKLISLYEFIANHISEESINSKKDIKTFDELYTSIIAYHKVKGGK